MEHDLKLLRYENEKLRTTNRRLVDDNVRLKVRREKLALLIV